MPSQASVHIPIASMVDENADADYDDEGGADEDDGEAHKNEAANTEVANDEDEAAVGDCNGYGAESNDYEADASCCRRYSHDRRCCMPRCCWFCD